MSTVFARAGLVTEQVRAEARQLDPAKVVLTLLMVVPFILGWTVSKVFGAVWLVCSFAWTATVVGWRTARGEDLG
jgi:hypothetical protein